MGVGLDYILCLPWLDRELSVSLGNFCGEDVESLVGVDWKQDWWADWGENLLLGKPCSDGVQEWSFIEFSERKQIVYSFEAAGMHSDSCWLIHLVELSISQALHYKSLFGLFFFFAWCPAELIMFNNPV